MQRKTLSIIASTFALAIVATPFIAKAQSNPNLDQSPNTEAPGHGRGHGRGHGHKGGMWKELGLTEQQKKDIKGIREAAKQEIHDKVLNNTQRQKVDAAPQPGSQRGHKRGLWKDLGLSEQQKKDIKSIREAAEKNIRDNVLTDAQRQKVDAFRAAHPHKKHR